MNLTFPEIVNKYNIAKLYKYVRNGNKVYPGAKSYKSGVDGRTIMLDYRDTSKIVLEYGDIVNRHLINGDVVLFNRQPSLHKMSMMAHTIYVMDGYTFRLNPNACKPYNADFDGDEMNMHVPQSIQTATELRYLASVARHIISPGTNGPIIQPAQDTLLGLFKLTDDATVFNQNELMNLMTMVQCFKGTIPEPAIIGGSQGGAVKWTGKQVFSMILPPLNMRFELKDAPAPVIIERGILKQGQIEKKCSAKIVHIIFNDFGYVEAARYLNDIQAVVTKYMIRSGFSVGISDLLIHPDIRRRNQDTIQRAKEDVMKLTREVHLNALEDSITKDLSTIYDSKVSGIANKVTEEVQQNTMKLLNLANRVYYIVKSGAKGDGINIQQMSCLLGQQIIDGKKVPLGFLDRSLPHYPRYENGMESRGFITGNFVEGLNPQEFFFHAMSGREGMIDTAVKTANSGYLQRRLVKATEDLKVAHDSSVRSSNNDIIEFCYGDDGFNSASLEVQKSNFILLTSEKLREYYTVVLDSGTASMQKWTPYLTAAALKSIKGSSTSIIGKQRDDSVEWYNRTVLECVELLHEKYVKYVTKISDLSMIYPVEFRRLIDNTLIKFDINRGIKTDLTPVDVILGLRTLFKYCVVADVHHNNTLKILACDYLSPVKLVRDLRMTPIAFEYIMQTIKNKFNSALAEGGEMVGPLAATSIGEISTQMTLNSVHYCTNVLLMSQQVATSTTAGRSQPPATVIHQHIGVFIENYIERTREVEYLASIATATATNPVDMQQKLKSRIQYKKDKDTIYCEISKDECVMIPSVASDGQCSWKRVTAVTRHPVINADGTNTVMRVELADGRTVIATTAKSFLVLSQATQSTTSHQELVEINGSDLRVGDCLPVISNADMIAADLLHNAVPCIDTMPQYVGTYQFGYILGCYLMNSYYDYDYDYDGDTDATGATGATAIVFNSQRNGDKFQYIMQFCIDNHIAFQYEYNNSSAVSTTLMSTGHLIKIRDLQMIRVIQLVCGKVGKYIDSAMLFKMGQDCIGGLIECVHISRDEIVLTTVLSPEILETLRMIATFWFPAFWEHCSDALNFKTHNKTVVQREIVQERSSYEKFRDVKLVPIVKITLLDNTHRYMYDFTVEDTKNFIIGNGICMRDTFHLAGVGEKSTVTAGVPRLDELLQNKKNLKNPSCRIYLTEVNRYDKERCRKIRTNLELTTIKDIILSSAIYLEPNNDVAAVLESDRKIMEIYKIFSAINPQAGQIPNNPWLIRLEFDQHKILEQNITMEDIHHILYSNYPDAFLMYFDNNAAKLIFRIRLNMESKTADDDILYLKNKIGEIEQIVVKGVDYITKVWMPAETAIFMREEDGLYSEKKEYYMDTDGSNLFDLLIKDGIDATRTYSVDPNDMLSVFGIEAARFTIENQLRILLENNSSTKISQRHLALLCNKMCQRGGIMAVHRHGINRENIGPLAKCSFEETSVQLQEAAVFGIADDIKGVSSNIMVGQIPNCGTGESELLVDEEMILNAEYPTDSGDAIADDSDATVVDTTHIGFDQFMKQDDVCTAVSNIKLSLKNFEADTMDFSALPTFTFE
jgi:DNA-directed RNA polymerase beta' subunit